MSGPAGRFPAPLLARVVLTVVLCGFYFVSLLRLASVADGVGVFLGAASTEMVLLALQIGYFTRPQPYGRWRFAALAVQAVLVYAPMFWFGEAWIGLVGFLGGSMLLTLRPAVAWPGVAAVVASAAWAQQIFTGLAIDIAYTAASSLIVALVTWGMTRLAHVVAELQQARVDLARLEVSRERLRIAQDLHDGLGSTLTAVTLLTELVRGRLRTGAADVASADEQLGDIARLSRQALTEVRTVSAGPMRTAVADELRHAGALLDAAGVHASMDVDLGALPAAAESAVAAVVRESVTNVLRHGGGRFCTVSLRPAGGTIVLTIDNDLPSPEAPAIRGDGHGIANINARVAKLGGTMHVGPGGDRTWSLKAVIPTNRAAGDRDRDTPVALVGSDRPGRAAK